MNIYDIAQICNVSTATVSRVINGSSKVSEATRVKVMAAINKSGYVPNSYARSLGSGCTKMVGVVCTNFADMFYAEAVSLVENGLRSNSYDCILYCASGDRQSNMDGLRMLAKQVDALLLVGTVFQEPIEAEEFSNTVANVPVVSINSAIPVENAYGVVSDEAGVIKDVIDDMIHQGLQRILYIYDSLTYSGTRKLMGYKAGLEKNGIKPDNALICCVERSLDQARSRLEDLIVSGVTFDGIIASEDMFAIAAQKAMQDSGMEAPIVSFNNSILASCANPRLTSIDFMLDSMCSTAIHLLFDLLKGKRIPKRVVIRPVIVERDTFKPDAKHYL